MDNLGYISTMQATPLANPGFAGGTNFPSRRGAGKRIPPSVSRPSAPTTQEESKPPSSTLPSFQAQPLPSTSSPPTETHPSMLKERCDFLEKSVRTLNAAVTELRVINDGLRAELDASAKAYKDLTSLPSSLTKTMGSIYDELQWVRAKYRLEEVWCGGEEGDSSPPRLEKVTRGDTVLMVYPMQERSVNGVKTVWMRRREVDSESGEVSFSWMMIHDTESYVEGFHF